MFDGTMTHPWQLFALGVIAAGLLAVGWLLLRREPRQA
jgi:hypothetical protein